MRAMVAVPNFPMFLIWQRATTAVTVAILLTVLAVALVRGWRPKAILAVLASGAGVLWLNVIIACGWCCEIFGEWLCSQI